MSKVGSRCAFALVLAAFAVALAAGILIGLYAIKPSRDTNLRPVNSLDHFAITDGLHMSWYHNANTRTLLQEAQNGDYMMITVDVSLFENSPVVSEGSSDFLLDEWLKSAFKHHANGIVLNFKSLNAIEPSLELVKTILQEVGLQQPIWVTVDVLQGPGGNTNTLSASNILGIVKRLNSPVTLNFGWTTMCCSQGYTQDMVDAMWSAVKNTSHPIALSVPAGLIRGSWDRFRSLLNKSSNLTLRIVASESDSWDKYDLLLVRNDCDENKIYYDISGPKAVDFRLIAITAGSAMHKYNIPNRDGARITWVHAVDSKQLLKEALDNNTMMLEADILLQGLNTGNETMLPIMAHPPDIYSDITLAEWLDTVLKTDRGIKMDFKTIKAVAPSLQLLKARRHLIRQPIWLNADILIGINTNRSPVPAGEFLQTVNDNFPAATLSTGWTTAWSNLATDGGYTRAMMVAMHNACRDLKQPITIPVRAVAARPSWDQFQWLLSQSRGYTLTIWHGSKDHVTKADMEYIYNNGDKTRVYFDVPHHLLPV